MGYAMAASPAISLPPTAGNYGFPPLLKEDFISAYFDGPLGPPEEDSKAGYFDGPLPPGEHSITAYFDGLLPSEEDWKVIGVPPGSSPIAAAANYGGPPPLEEDWKLGIPLGVRFRPTDKELILHYLQVEYLHGYIPRGIIAYADIYDYEPDQLEALAVNHGDGKMYFFTRIRKIGKSKTDRSIKSKNGYWKATQAPKSIKGESGITFGYKIPLTYIQNKVKTPWLMNEYRLESPNSQHSCEELVLAVVYHHGRKKRSDHDDEQN